MTVIIIEHNTSNNEDYNNSSVQYMCLSNSLVVMLDRYEKGIWIFHILPAFNVDLCSCTVRNEAHTLPS